MDTLVVPITLQRLRYVLENLSAEDRAELRAASIEARAEDVFSAGVCTAVDSGCIIMDGEPVAVFGVGAHPQDPGVGVAWMVTTDRFRERPAEMAHLSRMVVASWRRQFRVLTNVVHAQHRRAIRWLRWLGFTIDESAPVGPGRGFYLFRMETGDV